MVKEDEKADVMSAMGKRMVRMAANFNMVEVLVL